MDDETRREFKTVNSSITELSSLVKEDIAYREGLNLDERVKTTERKVENLKQKKASWYGLYLVIALFIAIVVGTTTVAALILNAPVK